MRSFVCIEKEYISGFDKQQKRKLKKRDSCRSHLGWKERVGRELKAGGEMYEVIR